MPALLLDLFFVALFIALLFHIVCSSSLCNARAMLCESAKRDYNWDVSWKKPASNAIYSGHEKYGIFMLLKRDPQKGSAMSRISPKIPAIGFLQSRHLVLLSSEIGRQTESAEFDHNQDSLETTTKKKARPAIILHRIHYSPRHDEVERASCLPIFCFASEFLATCRT